MATGKSMLHPTSIPELNSHLAMLVERVQGVLGDNLIGFYLQGSFAMGEHDVNSDVDFVGVLQHDLTDAELRVVEATHLDLWQRDLYWAKHIEGSYFPADILRNPTKTGLPLCYVDNGATEFERSDHCNTLVVRVTLRDDGLCLFGPPIDTLLDEITPPMLQREIVDVIVDWGQHLLDHPDKSNNAWYQVYLVQSFCRMWHNLQIARCTSKAASTKWALQHLPAEWHPLIKRSQQRRQQPGLSVYDPADQADHALSLQLVQYVIDQAKAFAIKNGR